MKNKILPKAEKILIDKYTKQVIVLIKNQKNKDGHKIRAGKYVAQGGHAVLKHFSDEGTIYKDDDGYFMQIPLTEPMVRWFQDKFTKIALSAKDEEELLDIYEKAKKAGLPCCLIEDAGLTEFSEPTNTAVGIGPALADDIDKITGNLPLFS